MNRKQRAWLYVGLWMVVIFFMSAQVSDDSSEQSGRVVELILRLVRLLAGETGVQWLLSFELEFYVRKLAHFTEYTILFLLAGRAFRLSGFRHGAVLSLLLCAGYACTDEFHQSFVPGRSMEARDVMIDTAGAMFGALLMLCWRGFAQMRRKRVGSG